MKIINMLMMILLVLSPSIGAKQITVSKDAYEIRRLKMDEDQRRKINEFLERISMIESGGGQNLDHPELQHGIHKGHRAMGQYGLMPNTVKEVVNRMRHEGLINPNIRNVSSMPPEEMKSTIESNPDYEKELAHYLANYVLNRQQGDEEKAAYSWHQGHNLTPDRISEQNYRDHDYVQKYNQFKNIKSKLGEK